MKKTLFIVAVTATMLCGCAKEQIQKIDSSESEKIVTLTCTIPQTKLSVNNEGKTVWQEGDSIAVFNDERIEGKGGVMKKYGLVSGAGTNKGTFAGPAFETGTNARIALYPAKYGEEGSFQKSNENRLVMHINGSYTMTSADASQNVPAIMVAYIANNATSITFEHVASLLKLQFTGIPANARKIKIYQNVSTTEANVKKYGIIGDRFFTVTNLKEAGGSGVDNVGCNDGTNPEWVNMSIAFPENKAIESGNGTFYFPITLYRTLTTRTFKVNFLDASNQVIANTERTLSSAKFTAGNMIVFPTVPALTKTVAVESVSVDPTEVTIAPGEKASITATVLPADATDKSVNWTSSEESVATVSDGVVTAVAVGTTTITATTADGGKTATCTVTVAAESKIIADWDLNNDKSKTEASFKETTDFQTTFPGDNGRNVVATTGTGAITYYAVTSRTSGSKNFARLVGGNGDPYTQGCLPGDYWLIDATASKTIPAGTTLSISFVTKCGNATTNYWLLEFKDGVTWKPVKATSTKQESATLDIGGNACSYKGDITYNLYFTKLEGTNGAYIAVNETFTTSVDMTNIQLRFSAAGQLAYEGTTLEGKWISNIYSKSSQQRFSAQRPTKADGTADKIFDQHVTLKIADK